MERDPQRVLEDTINGLVTIERAKKDYGVILDDVGCGVDLEATLNLRQRKLMFRCRR